jgi:hypothetical protein
MSFIQETALYRMRLLNMMYAHPVIREMTGDHPVMTDPAEQWWNSLDVILQDTVSYSPVRNKFISRFMYTYD